jgi:hypothetical protein
MKSAPFVPCEVERAWLEGLFEVPIPAGAPVALETRASGDGYALGLHLELPVVASTHGYLLVNVVPDDE